MYELFLKKAHYCPVIQAAVLICGALMCYLIAYLRSDVSIYLPFISETGAYTPEKCIFSLILILGSFIGCFIVLFQFLITCQSPLNNVRSFSWMNIGSFFLGITSMLGMAGVAAFPMTTVFWAHLMFAAMYFGGSASYFIVISIITYKIEGVSTKSKLRGSLSIAITVFLFFLVILFPISLVNWQKHNDVIAALKTPEKEGFTLLLLSSILEWAVVIVIILFTLTLMMDIKNHCFQITVNPDTPKNTDVPVTSPTAVENN